MTAIRPTDGVLRAKIDADSYNTTLNEVNAKYAIYDKSNKEMMSKKQQETMAIYKREGVSPFGSIGTMLLTMPIFLAMWRVISALPFYKIGTIAGVSFGSSSLSALFGGAPAALLIMIPVCFIQYVSFKAPTWLAKKRKGVKKKVKIEIYVYEEMKWQKKKR